MPEILTDSTSFKDAIQKPHLTVIHFAADWADQCPQVDDLLDTLNKHNDYSNVKFYKVLAENTPDVSLEYEIAVVPAVLLFRSNKIVDRIEGADPAKITNKIKANNSDSIAGDGGAGDDKPLEERLKSLINKAPVMLFMKGNRENPRCGFSRQIIQILNDQGSKYETFDILTDEEVRQGLKTYSDWPTYPQLYIKGELIGGLDIVKEMLTAGELATALKIN